MREQRVAVGLSCEQLAISAEVSPETVRRAESGRGHPSARVVAALADALGMPVDELAPQEGPVTLRQLRQRTQQTQRAVADQVGVSSQMVSRVEQGTYGVKEPARWAAAYRVPVRQWKAAWAAGREARRQQIRSQTRSDGGTE
ncbi:helix-turn-helix domain-containing protein [Streptomyces sp. HUAS TT7]|uniref:helix-turn-helix domain-containing protein n=1 Tax=Streptomyces sp. HUAS TT7 TaxID=3447507 RepID=UPI003F656FCE